ncbi:MAG: PqqD family protein [Anaerostipes sp.]|jgi:hypothetical protein
MIAQNKNIIKRKIHDSYFLIDITQNYFDDTCNLYEINEIGSFIWEQMNNACSIDKIVNQLSLEIKACDVEKDTIKTDVKDYIKVLFEEGFLEVIDEV